MPIEAQEYNTASVFAVLESVKLRPSDEIESETVEFKEYSSEKSLHNDSELPGEICALANRKGGLLICGVRDGSKVQASNWPSQLVGFPSIDPITTGDRIKGRLQNSVQLHIENIAFESKNYLAIFVQKHRSSVVMTTQGKAYIREGRSSRPMTPEEVERAVKSLQNYDWSADFIEGLTSKNLSAADVQKALEVYCQLRKLEQVPTTDAFLESIEATKNGLITKGGLLFLGESTAIKKYLGDIEFRFSWKEGVTLKRNEVWAGNLWNAIQKAKDSFQSCVSNVELKYKENTFTVPNLDPIAFHEAFLNAVAHRDYSIDGMVSVEFVGSRLTITSPGLFYGGVSPDNIFFHDPRHRNKALARTLMEYKFVDRAGMGILRMGIKSLVYGRRFPTFEEQTDSVKVSMEAEYIRPGIFVLTRERTELHIPDLVILNSLYEKGHLEVVECIELIGKTAQTPWHALDKFVERWSQFVEFCGTKEAVSIRVKETAKDLFQIQKPLRLPQNSIKFVTLFHFLRKHGSATNEEISDLLEYSHSSTTSRFLADLDWVERTGKGVASKWRLTPQYT
jgi:predicted HTH transcriptional regulator